MPVTRRTYLKVLSGGLIASALPTLQGCATGMPEEAVQAWRSAPPADSEVRRWALSHALLAPNPHNLQPWIVDLSESDQITLLYDTTRSLPETDPYYRQLVIGCGAFLELLVMALQSRGVGVEMRLFPEGEFENKPDTRPISRLQLIHGGASAADPLFAQVRRRFTHRMPFDTTKPLSPATLHTLREAPRGDGVRTHGVLDGAQRDALRSLARDAWDIEVRTPRTHLESVRLTRIGKDEILRHRDGITLTGFLPNLAHTLGWMAPEKVTKPGSSGFDRTLEYGRAQAATAMGWIWLTTAGNSRSDQIAAGRAYVRTHLRATALGVALHPMSQILQEYSEMTQVQTQLYQALAIDPGVHRVQMLARIGCADGASPSPRRELATLIRS